MHRNSNSQSFRGAHDRGHGRKPQQDDMQFQYPRLKEGFMPEIGRISMAREKAELTHKCLSLLERPPNAPLLVTDIDLYNDENAIVIKLGESILMPCEMVIPMGCIDLLVVSPEANSIAFKLNSAPMVKHPRAILIGFGYGTVYDCITITCNTNEGKIQITPRCERQLHLQLEGRVFTRPLMIYEESTVLRERYSHATFDEIHHTRDATASEVLTVPSFYEIYLSNLGTKFLGRASSNAMVAVISVLKNRSLKGEECDLSEDIGHSYMLDYQHAHTLKAGHSHYWISLMNHLYHTWLTGQVLLEGPRIISFGWLSQMEHKMAREAPLPPSAHWYCARGEVPPMTLLPRFTVARATAGHRSDQYNFQWASPALPRVNQCYYEAMKYLLDETSTSGGGQQPPHADPKGSMRLGLMSIIHTEALHKTSRDCLPVDQMKELIRMAGSNLTMIDYSNSVLWDSGTSPHSLVYVPSRCDCLVWHSTASTPPRHTIGYEKPEGDFVLREGAKLRVRRAHWTRHQSFDLSRLYRYESTPRGIWFVPSLHLDSSNRSVNGMALLSTGVEIIKVLSTKETVRADAIHHETGYGHLIGVSQQRVLTLSTMVLTLMTMFGLMNGPKLASGKRPHSLTFSNVSKSSSMLGNDILKSLFDEYEADSLLNVALAPLMSVLYSHREEGARYHDSLTHNIKRQYQRSVLTDMAKNGRITLPPSYGIGVMVLPDPFDVLAKEECYLRCVPDPWAAKRLESFQSVVVVPSWWEDPYFTKLRLAHDQTSFEGFDNVLFVHPESRILAHEWAGVLPMSDSCLFPVFNATKGNIHHEEQPLNWLYPDGFECGSINKESFSRQVKIELMMKDHNHSNDLWPVDNELVQNMVERIESNWLHLILKTDRWLNLLPLLWRPERGGLDLGSRLQSWRQELSLLMSDPEFQQCSESLWWTRQGRGMIVPRTHVSSDTSIEWHCLDTRPMRELRSEVLKQQFEEVEAVNLLMGSFRTGASVLLGLPKLFDELVTDELYGPETTWVELFESSLDTGQREMFNVSRSDLSMIYALSLKTYEQYHHDLETCLTTFGCANSVDLMIKLLPRSSFQLCGDGDNDSIEYYLALLRWSLIEAFSNTLIKTRELFLRCGLTACPYLQRIWVTCVWWDLDTYDSEGIHKKCISSLFKWVPLYGCAPDMRGIVLGDVVVPGTDMYSPLKLYRRENLGNVQLGESLVSIAVDRTESILLAPIVSMLVFALTSALTIRNRMFTMGSDPDKKRLQKIQMWDHIKPNALHDRIVHYANKLFKFAFEGEYQKYNGICLDDIKPSLQERHLQYPPHFWQYVHNSLLRLCTENVSAFKQRPAGSGASDGIGTHFQTAYLKIVMTQLVTILMTGNFNYHNLKELPRYIQTNRVSVELMNTPVCLRNSDYNSQDSDAYRRVLRYLQDRIPYDEVPGYKSGDDTYLEGEIKRIAVSITRTEYPRYRALIHRLLLAATEDHLEYLKRNEPNPRLDDIDGYGATIKSYGDCIFNELVTGRLESLTGLTNGRCNSKAFAIKRQHQLSQLMKEKTNLSGGGDKKTKDEKVIESKLSKNEHRREQITKKETEKRKDSTKKKRKSKRRGSSSSASKEVIKKSKSKRRGSSSSASKEVIKKSKSKRRGSSSSASKEVTKKRKSKRRGSSSSASKEVTKKSKSKRRGSSSSASKEVTKKSNSRNQTEESYSSSYDASS